MTFVSNVMTLACDVSALQATDGDQKQTKEVRKTDTPASDEGNTEAFVVELIVQGAGGPQRWCLCFQLPSTAEQQCFLMQVFDSKVWQCAIYKTKQMFSLCEVRMTAKHCST